MSDRREDVAKAVRMILPPVWEQHDGGMTRRLREIKGIEAKPLPLHYQIADAAIAAMQDTEPTEAEQELALTDDERKQLRDIAYQAFWERHPVFNSAGDRIMSEQHERMMRNDLYTLSLPTLEAMLEAVARRVWKAARKAGQP